ncbi:MAG: FAD-dependent oxidoreductase, partial [Simkaniaceae bacterium]|nr:FAD-dependent oxidoreductase [Simkaniaceae bacterium]
MTDIQRFDLAVIGAGPGGYVAAIKAAQMGKSVALIEKEYLGGTCLNVGCIPTKTLLAGSQVLHTIKQAEKYGIETGPVKFHYRKMKERKDNVVSGIRKSLEGLIKSNGITIFHGLAEFVTPQEIKISGDTKQLIFAEKTIIATGSDTLDIPAFPCDHKKIVNSSSILELEELPKSLVIIGGGYIGCEFASLFVELGVKVTIVEALPSIIAMQGKKLSDFLSRAFKKKGMEILTETMVENIEQTGSGLKIH